MAVTITRLAASPGTGARAKAMAAGTRVTDFEVFKVAFDSSYPTGGEDISVALNRFKSVLGVFVQSHDITIADNRHFLVDLTNKKLIVLDAINTEEGSTTDLSALTDIRILVVGYK